MVRNGSKSKAVVEEIEDDDDLELMDDDGDEDEASAKPAKKTKSKTVKTETVESTGYGAAWLADYINEELNTNYTAAQMRTVLRRLAAAGELEREVGTDRARYSFTGEKDPTVRAVLKRVKSGEVDAEKRERIEAAKSGSKKAKAKAAKAEVMEDADDDEVEEVKPVKKRRKAEATETVETPAPKKATRKRNNS